MVPLRPSSLMRVTYPLDAKKTLKSLDYKVLPMRQVSTFYGMWTAGRFIKMKSQDFLLLFKMASLHAQEEKLFGLEESVQDSSGSTLDFLEAIRGMWSSQTTIAEIPQNRREGNHDPSPAPHNDPKLAIEPFIVDEEKWEGWTDVSTRAPLSSWLDAYSLRALSESTGLSKSEVSNSLARCREAGLLINDYDTSQPRVNRRELLKITEHALKYFFPVKPGAIVRGIPTGFAAPALSKNLKSAGGLIPVWPDPFGSERGQAIEPIYKSVPDAVKKDKTLYHYLALVDAIRVGGPRECGVAINMLKSGMGLK